MGVGVSLLRGRILLLVLVVGVLAVQVRSVLMVNAVLLDAASRASAKRNVGQALLAGRVTLGWPRTAQVAVRL